MRRLTTLAGVLLASFVTTLHETPPAAACGGFAARRSATPPYLAEELVLIDHDGKTERFVREVRFRGADDHFGFVVPTPTQPSVDKVKSPFPMLRARFPYAKPDEHAVSRFGGDEAFPRAGMGFGAGLGLAPGGGMGRGLGAGSGGGSKEGGVHVLEEKRVGSFTAFVLQADDPKALSAWLEKNDLAMTKEAEPWVARYVGRKFYFTAFRYEKPADASSLVSETVSLTFATPVAYYPYEEPRSTAARTERQLQVWTVTPAPVAPIAAHASEAEVVWKRPFRGGMQTIADAKELEEVLGAPHAAAVVQPYVDDKLERAGWGDALLVPATPTALSPDDRAARSKLVGLLLPEAP